MSISLMAWLLYTKNSMFPSVSHDYYYAIGISVEESFCTRTITGGPLKESPRSSCDVRILLMSG